MIAFRLVWGRNYKKTLSNKEAFVSIAVSSSVNYGQGDKKDYLVES
jgi:hypothetical protein